MSLKLWIAGTTEQCARAAETGLVSAVVTNPTVMADWTGGTRSLESACRNFVAGVDLPLYVQLKGPTAAEYVAEAEHLRKISPIIIPKIPGTLEGFAAVRQLRARDVPTLVTTICSVNQAYLAAVSGAAAICPYVARLNESGDDAFALIRDAAAMYRAQGCATEIMPASVRTPADVTGCLTAGANGVIIFHDLFTKLADHAVMARSLKQFDADDWSRTPYEFDKKL